MTLRPLFIVLFLVNSGFMWLFGDFNVYVGSGADLELKSFPTPTERLLGSLLLGFVSALVSIIGFVATWQLNRSHEEW